MARTDQSAFGHAPSLALGTAFLTASAKSFETDFGEPWPAAGAQGAPIVLTMDGSGAPPASVDTVDLFAAMPKRTYDGIHVGKSVRAFQTPWFAALLCHLNRGLVPGGVLVVPFYSDAEAQRKGFWSLSWLESILDARGEELPGHRLRFRRREGLSPPPSCLTWFYEEAEGGYWRSEDAETFQRMRPEELSERFADVLAPNAPIGRGNRHRFSNFSEELQEAPYAIGAAACKAAILQRLLCGHFQDRQGVSMVDVGGGYGQVVIELLLDGSCPVEKAQVVDISPIKLALASRLRNRFAAHVGDRFHFRLQPAEQLYLNDRVDVISFIGSLMLVPRSEVAATLDRMWESINPGGLLIVHENIKAAHYSRDRECMFTKEELEGFLCHLGHIRYFMSTATVEIQAANVANKSVFRVIEKAPRG